MAERDDRVGAGEPGQAAGSGGRPGRGHLRIYLGSAAGVGKTYAMLGEGHRRAERGADVVVAFAEPHQRPLTIALLEGLEIPLGAGIAGACLVAASNAYTELFSVAT